MDSQLQGFQQNLTRTIQSLKEDLKLIRTGRASPALIEDFVVEAYGGQTKLKLLELAAITTDGSTTLLIAPFDPTVTSDIEKAILKSSLGLTPSVQGTKIVIKIPPLSQEQREKMIKLISQKIEEKKNIIRNHRDEIRKKVRLQLEQKSITEDDKFRIEKEIDNIASKNIDEVQQIKEKKEKEIMEV